MGDDAREIGLGERIASRLERADERCTGVRFGPMEAQYLAAAARSSGLREALMELDESI